MNVDVVGAIDEVKPDGLIVVINPNEQEGIDEVEEAISDLAGSMFCRQIADKARRDGAIVFVKNPSILAIVDCRKQPFGKLVDAALCEAEERMLFHVAILIINVGARDPHDRSAAPAREGLVDGINDFLSRNPESVEHITCVASHPVSAEHLKRFFPC